MVGLSASAPINPSPRVFGSVLHGALYWILASLVLVPKTVLQTVIRPVQLSRYLEEQLRSDVLAEGFETFSHPIATFVLVAVIPAIAMVPVFEGFLVLANQSLRSAVAQTGVVLPSDFVPVLVSTLVTLRSLSVATKFLMFFLLLASWPVSTGSVIQYFRSKKLRSSVARSFFTLSELRFAFYMQLYLYSILYLWYFFAAFFVCVYPRLLTSSIFAVVILYCPACYFAYCEWRIIQEQTQTNRLRAAGIVSILFIAGFVGMAICEVITLLPMFLSDRGAK